MQQALCTFEANGEFSCNSQQETYTNVPSNVSVQFAITLKHKTTGKAFITKPHAVPSLSSFKDDPKGFAMEATGLARTLIAGSWIDTVQSRVVNTDTLSKVDAQVQVFLVNPAERRRDFLANLPSSIEQTPLILSRLYNESRSSKYTHVELRLLRQSTGRRM